MKLQPNLHVCLLALTLLGATTAGAASMTRVEHNAAEDRINATYKTQRSACKSLKANANDVCEKQAKAEEKVAKAELQASYTGKAADQDKLRLVKADTAYDVAKEMCDDKAGNDKDVCIQEAKGVQAKSRADTTIKETVRGAINDDSQARLNADYMVAVEKCDALAGEAKSSCVTQAKTKFGKN